MTTLSCCRAYDIRGQQGRNARASSAEPAAEVAQAIYTDSTGGLAYPSPTGISTFGLRTPNPCCG